MSYSKKKAHHFSPFRRVWNRFLGLGFHLLYNEMAWSYDAVSWLVSRGQWRSWQKAALPFLQGQRVMELAHGPGHMLLKLEAAGFNVVGLDLSAAMGRMASRRIRRHESSVRLIRGRAQVLPFADSVFDSILATFPTEFMAEAMTIQELSRVLHDAGRLVVVPQAHLTSGGKVDQFIEWLYAITGQRPPALAEGAAGFWQTVHDRFVAAGFDLKVETVKLETSEVMVIVAQKEHTSNLLSRPSNNH